MSPPRLTEEASQMPPNHLEGTSQNLLQGIPRQIAPFASGACRIHGFQHESRETDGRNKVQGV